MLVRQISVIGFAVMSLSSAWAMEGNAIPREASRMVAQVGKTQVIEPRKIESNRVPDPVRRLLSKSGQLELFSLDPLPLERGPTGFHEHRILGSTTLTGDAAKRLVAALEEGASEPMFGPAACFLLSARRAAYGRWEPGRPRHLLRMQQCPRIRGRRREGRGRRIILLTRVLTASCAQQGPHGCRGAAADAVGKCLRSSGSPSSGCRHERSTRSARRCAHSYRIRAA